MWVRAFIVPDCEGSSFEVERKDAMVSLLILRMFNSATAKEVRLDHLRAYHPYLRNREVSTIFAYFL